MSIQHFKFGTPQSERASAGIARFLIELGIHPGEVKEVHLSEDGLDGHLNLSVRTQDQDGSKHGRGFIFAHDPRPVLREIERAEANGLLTPLRVLYSDVDVVTNNNKEDNA